MDWSVTLTTHFQLVLTLRMSRLYFQSLILRHGVKFAFISWSWNFNTRCFLLFIITDNLKKSHPTTSHIFIWIRVKNNRISIGCFHLPRDINRCDIYSRLSYVFNRQKKSGMKISYDTQQTLQKKFSGSGLLYISNL